MTNAMPARLLCMIALAACLPACTDTIVFGAQREIDVAIVVNEDVAEPVSVNIGLNSQIAGLVPSLDSKPAESTLPLLKYFRSDDPEGEAASIFSGFRYTSETDIVPAKKFDYSAEIRSQFASGAAAMILATNPDAVAQVVNISDSWGLQDALQEKLLGLSEGGIAVLYKDPPTLDLAVEAEIAELKEKAGYAATCDDLPQCRLRVTQIRLDSAESPADLERWEQAIKKAL